MFQQRFSTWLKICTGVALLLNLGACDNNASTDNDPTFDRSAMLQHYANNLIVPAYTQLQASVAQLQTQVATLTTNPSSTAVVAAQAAWSNAYQTWQRANGYNFGPAGEQGIRRGLIEEIGTFPAAEGKIEAFIANNDASLNNFDRDARGFLALEYLLFGKNTTPANLATQLQGSSARRTYTLALANHLKTRVDEVVQAWATYAPTFASNAGTDVGSSTSQLYNEFVRSFEAIKNFKVGLPAGKRPGQVKAEPQLLEAYYSGQSLAMIRQHLLAIEAIYYGRGNNGNSGPGLKDYLATTTGGPELIALTEAQWQKVKAALDQVPTSTPFEALVAANHPAVDNLHTELQKHTRFFKSDMSSLLGIAITFSSGDGD